MSDVECPYCGHGQEINHDDGYGYEENVKHEQECSNCEKTFVFVTSIMLLYDVAKAACLNGEEHKYEPTNTIPKKYTKMICEYCGDERRLADEEREKYGIPPLDFEII